MVWVLKKVDPYHRARHRSQPQRPQEFLQTLLTTAHDGLIYLDESGVSTQMTCSMSGPARPGHVVVKDNLSSHKVKGVREHNEAGRARLLYRPPYSPYLNPIEKLWAKLKKVSGISAHRVPPRGRRQPYPNRRRKRIVPTPLRR